MGEVRAWWSTLAASAIALAVCAICAARYSPPAARATSSDSPDFSGMRAGRLVRELLGDGSPHPTGSEANARVRERIVSALTRLGYEAKTQSGERCTELGICSTVHNVYAVAEGARARDKVLLTAHYDSVPAAPGAGDDIAGVATVLEAARALRFAPGSRERNGLVLLLTDGEEVGLAGAEIFMRDALVFSEVRAVVNLEAQGTSGPSMLFETGLRSAATIDLVADSIERPVTTSLFSRVYDTLRQITDLTAYRRRPGIEGANFAFIGSPLRYHSPTDDADHLSLDSVQHHGDNALALTRAFLATDLPARPDGDAVFFDVLALRVVHWPRSWSAWLALLSLTVACGSVLVALKRAGTRWREIAAAAGVSWLVPIGGGVMGAAIGALLGVAGALPGPWIERPSAARIAAALGALSCASVGAIWLSRMRTSAMALWAGVWIPWCTLGVVIAIWEPLASYLFAVPALIAATLAPLWARADVRESAIQRIIALVPIAAASVVWIPVVWLLYDALGLVPLAITSAACATALVPFVPVFAEVEGRRSWAIPAASALGVVGAVALAITAPPFTRRTPQPLSLVFHEDASARTARWIVSDVGTGFPDRVVRALGDRAPPGARSATVRAAFPWSRRKSLIVRAQAIRLEPPSLRIDERRLRAGGRGRYVRAWLSSPRGATVAKLQFPQRARLRGVRIGGATVPMGRSALWRDSFNGWQVFECTSLPSGGIAVELDVATNDPIDAVMLDMSRDLPPSSRSIVRARGASAVTSDEGDLTIVSRRIRL